MGSDPNVVNLTFRLTRKRGSFFTNKFIKRLDKTSQTGGRFATLSVKGMFATARTLNRTSRRSVL